MPRVITKQLAGIEDLTLGNSVEVQSRNGVNVNITQISGETIPFDTPTSPTIKDFITATATQAQFLDITSDINVTAKITGKEVWDSTNSRPLWSRGTAANSVWVDYLGATVFTPV